VFLFYYTYYEMNEFCIMSEIALVLKKYMKEATCSESYRYVFLYKHVYFLKLRLNLRIRFGSGHGQESK
jgi:hypothetical protein